MGFICITMVDTVCVFCRTGGLGSDRGRKAAMDDTVSSAYGRGGFKGRRRIGDSNVLPVPCALYGAAICGSENHDQTD